MHSTHLLVIVTNLYACLNITEALVQENFELRIFDPKFSMEDAQLEKLIEQANLEKHGFTKSSTSTMVSEGNSEPFFKRTVRYMKNIPCDKVAEEEKKLQQLIPSVITKELIVRTEKDMTGTKGMCQAGLEIHYRKYTPSQCRTRNTDEEKRGVGMRKPMGCSWCGVCWRVSAGVARNI